MYPLTATSDCRLAKAAPRRCSRRVLTPAPPPPRPPEAAHPPRPPPPQARGPPPPPPTLPQQQAADDGEQREGIGRQEVRRKETRQQAESPGEPSRSLPGAQGDGRAGGEQRDGRGEEDAHQLTDTEVHAKHGHRRGHRQTGERLPVGMRGGRQRRRGGKEIPQERLDESVSDT